MRMSGSPPRTLAEDLRARSDAELAALFTARPDLLNPIPSDMRALTTRAATAPSIARYLDDVDAIHHYVLRIASEITAGEPTTLDRIVETSTSGLDPTSRQSIQEAADNLWAAALLWGTADRTHVVTSVRDQVAHAPLPAWPAPTCGVTPTMTTGDVDAAAGLQARTVLAMLEEIADLWRREPAPVLRSGGLATRALDAVAAALGVDRDDLACTLDVAHAAGLFGVGPTAEDLGWMPTPDYDDWCADTAERRWATLVHAWLTSPVSPGERPLEPDEHPFTIQWRRQMLEVLADCEGPCGVDEVIAVVDFRRPRRSSPKRASVITALVRQAEILGVVSHGAMSSAGRRAAQGADTRQLAAAIRPYLVGEIERVHVQGDHTIVAPGPLTPQVGRKLRNIADVESRGHATVLRLTSSSVRRALATDPDPQAWIDFLNDISSNELPQSMVYLIGDAARADILVQPDFIAPRVARVKQRTRITVSPANVEKALRILRSEEARDALNSDVVEVPKLESAAVVAQLRYCIDHHETVHLTHAESDGSTAVLLVDPIRLGGGSLTAYDHHREQVRTLAISRISGVAALQVSA